MRRTVRTVTNSATGGGREHGTSQVQSVDRAIAIAEIDSDGQRIQKCGRHIQEVLGEHQDAAIAADEWRDIALAHADDTELVITCGRLVERERAAVHASRARYAPVWERADQPKLTGWLRG